MNITVSPQIKILALVGLLAAVGLGASMFVLGGSSKNATTSTPTLHTPAKTRTPVTPPTTKHRTVVHAPAKHVAKTHTVVPAKAHHTHAKPSTFHGNPVYAQLPKALAVAARTSQGGRGELLQPELERRCDLGR